MIGLFLLRFERPEQAERRIAGAAVSAHLAALADRAGAHDIRIVTANDVPLKAEAWDDVRRACPSARFDGYEGAPAVAVSGRMLVAPEALRDFAESAAQTLCWRGQPVARKTAGSGGGSLDIADDQAVSCDDRDAAERWLLKRTSKPGDGIVSRRINRPISQAISRHLLRIDGIRPWHMTVVTALFAMAMIVALMSKGYGALVAAGLLFHAASVIDGVDGEIARASYRSSVSGATLDTAVDMATNVSFYLGFTLAMGRLYGARVAGLGGITLGLALLGLGIMAWLARRIGQSGFDFLKRFYTARLSTGLSRVIVDSFITIMSRDFFAFAWAILIVIRAPLIITYGLAFFSLLWVILILIAAPALLRDGARLAPARLAVGRGSS
ncbi:MAG TPA: CDP-alcohol phosphatidyltransferase family protein [Allosphingosinicella sp.]|jgi:CDP-L-myo-inositol myo-inositolphosphotransferase|nr:CDP-alcohol phosphatidyltransferase family protein [Allosphingosinicella sp.]